MVNILLQKVNICNGLPIWQQTQPDPLFDRHMNSLFKFIFSLG